MFRKYLYVFLISMVPIVELRGAVVVAHGMNLNELLALWVCVIGNLIPVPFIYFFARRFLLWGTQRKWIGKFCRFCVEKGERAGQKLVAKTGRKGLFVALVLFVGIPLPGTGAWTGTLGASFLDMGFKSTVVAVILGVLLAGVIMTLVSMGAFHFIGL